MAYIFDLVDTWNDGATTFTAVKMNVTDTASNASSLLMDLQVGGSSKFKVQKNGAVTFSNGTIISDAGGVDFATNSVFRSGAIGFGASSDAILGRRGAANLRFGAADAAAPVAQTLSVQSGTAGASALTCSISGTTLTVGTATGTIAVGHAVTGTGVTAGTTIVSGAGSTWTVSASQTVSSTTMYFNSVGQNLTLTGSQGSGPSAGGSIIFQVAPAGAAGTTAQNALATALTIDNSRTATFTGTINTSSGVLSNGVSVGYYLAGQTQGLTFALGAAINTPDVYLARDAANTLALRNGANAQAFRVYNTWTSFGSGTEIWERGNIFWDSNVLKIGTEKGANGGTARNMEFQTDGTTRLTISVFGPSLPAGSVLAWAGRAALVSPADGIIRLRNANDNDFDRLQFGGTTSSFPALKRVSANLQVIAADGTSSAGMIVGNQALAITATDGFLYVPTCAGTPTGTPTAQTGTVPIIVDTTANKLYFYSGAAWRDAGP
jgi:hypothetical protein